MMHVGSVSANRDHTFSKLHSPSPSLCEILLHRTICLQCSCFVADLSALLKKQAQPGSADMLPLCSAWLKLYQAAAQSLVQLGHGGGFASALDIYIYICIYIYMYVYIYIYIRPGLSG